MAQWSSGPEVTPRTKINELPGHVHVHSIQINVQKPDRVSATEGHLPAVDHNQQLPLHCKNPICFPKINPVVMYMYTIFTFMNKQQK